MIFTYMYCQLQNLIFSVGYLERELGRINKFILLFIYIVQQKRFFYRYLFLIVKFKKKCKLISEWVCPDPLKSFGSGRIRIPDTASDSRRNSTPPGENVLLALRAWHFFLGGGSFWHSWIRIYELDPKRIRLCNTVSTVFIWLLINQIGTLTTSTRPGRQPLTPG